MPKGTSFDKWYRHQTRLSDRTTTKEKKNKNECCVNKSHIISVVPFCAKESHFLPQILYWWDILATLCYYTMIK